MFTKPILILTFTVMTAYAPNTLADSLWSKLKNRVQNEVENVVTGKVARKAGDEAGDATDAVLNPQPSESTDSDNRPAPPTQTANNDSSTSNQGDRKSPSTSLPSLGGLSGMLDAMQQEVPIDDTYKFDISMTMEITSDNETNTMQQALSNNAMMINIDAGQSIIMDLQKEAMIMLNKKDKTKSAMSTNFIKKMAQMGGGMSQQKDQNSAAASHLKKTGKTKKIIGYTAEQWTFDDGERSGEVWITDEVNFDFIGLSTRMGKLFGGSQNQNFVDFSKLEGKYPRGIMLETTTFLNGKKETHAKTTELINTTTTVDLTPYATTSMMDSMGNY